MTDLEALAALRPHIPAGKAAELRAWLDAKYAAARLADCRPQHDAVDFTWHGGRSFSIDGRPFNARGVGLLLAWMVLVGHQTRLQGLEPREVYPGTRRPDAVALQAIQRAAMHAPEPLASAMQTIGTVGGVLAVKGRLPCVVVCRSPELIRAVTKA